jgi:hypothetical protein
MIGNNGKWFDTTQRLVYTMVFLVGLTFLVQALGGISSELANTLWPIFLMVAGGAGLMSQK